MRTHRTCKFTNPQFLQAQTQKFFANKMWDKIKIPGKDHSFRDDTDFALFMKWFEVFAEDTIFETNSFRRTILSATIERLSSLLEVQKKREFKTDEKLLTLSKINNAKRRKN